jgi:Lar family restriction alleviation protein
MMRNEIMPCPFCGSRDQVIWKGAIGKNSLCMVACVNCGMSGPTKSTERQCLEVWNLRLSLDAPRDMAEDVANGKIELEKIAVQNEMILLELRRKAFAQFERETLTTPLRFDGLYQSEKYLDTGDGRLYWNYLRFYRSGTVLGVCMTGGPRECLQWLQPRNESGDLSRGRYQIVGSTIRFTTVNSHGTVNYQGIIKAKLLELEYHSKTNGNRGILDFRFVCA